MRIWHTALIEALPRQQLVAQWRELSSIATSIKTKGTPNHVLVNFVMDYDFDHFISYAHEIWMEMHRRGYRPSEAVWNKIVDLKPRWKQIPIDKIYVSDSIKDNKMDEFYLTICYYNLWEKYACGMFDDFGQIESAFLNARDRYRSMK